jgi:hypothetical protein
MSHLLYAPTRLLRRLVTGDAREIVLPDLEAPESSHRCVELIFESGDLEVGVGPMPEMADPKLGEMRGLDDIGARPPDVGFVGRGLWPELPASQGPHTLELMREQYVSLRAKTGQINVTVKITHYRGGA